MNSWHSICGHGVQCENKRGKKNINNNNNGSSSSNVPIIYWVCVMVCSAMCAHGKELKKKQVKKKDCIHLSLTWFWSWNARECRARARALCDACNMCDVISSSANFPLPRPIYDDQWAKWVKMKAASMNRFTCPLSLFLSLFLSLTCTIFFSLLFTPLVCWSSSSSAANVQGVTHPVSN